MSFTRRYCMSALVAAAAAWLPLHCAAKELAQPTWGPFVGMSIEQMDALDAQSQNPSSGQLLPNGVRVIDLVIGTGPEPQQGSRKSRNSNKSPFVLRASAWIAGAHVHERGRAALFPSIDAPMLQVCTAITRFGPTDSETAQ